MSFHYAKEEKKWRLWKEKEEKILRNLHVDEQIIQQLRLYDWKQFNVDRSYRSKQTATLDNFFTSFPIYDHKEINTVTDILDEIENEALFDYLSKTDKDTLNIILLKMLGYKTREISEVLGINISTIYSKITRLKKKLKDLK